VEVGPAGHPHGSGTHPTAMRKNREGIVGGILVGLMAIVFVFF
jgi:hypothetical protein